MTRAMAAFTLGPLGLAIGLPIGARAAKPGTATSGVLVAAAAVALVAAAALSAGTFGGYFSSPGSMEGQVSMIIGGLGIIVVALVAAGLWACFAVGLFVGSLLGAVFRKRPARIGDQGVPTKR